MLRIFSFVLALFALTYFSVSVSAQGLPPDLGRKLFYDPVLSGSGTTACATCHNPGNAFAQPRNVAVSDNGMLGRRNVPSLLDVGLLPALTWDGHFPSLEHQVFGPFSTGELGNSIEAAARRLNTVPEYLRQFDLLFGQRPTPDNLAQALAAYERTLVSRESRVDQFLVHNDSTALSPIERDGFEIFTRRARCSGCHQLSGPGPIGRPSARPLFTDFGYHNLGVGLRPGAAVMDAGRFEITRRPADRGAFRTPMLRTSLRAPPYMHDGSFATLEEVVEFYNAGGQPNPNQSPLIRPLLLSGREKAALIAFLRAIAD